MPALQRLSFRLLPSLSPAFRTRRLLALTLRDLRRLMIDRSPSDWQSHVYSRLTAMPNEATPLQRAQLLAALPAGSEIIHLRHTARHLGLGSNLGAKLAVLAKGHSAQAIAQLSRLDDALAANAVGGRGTEAILRARATALIFAKQQAGRYGKLAHDGAGSVQNAQHYTSQLQQQEAVVQTALENRRSRAATNRLAEGAAPERRGERRAGKGPAPPSGGESRAHTHFSPVDGYVTNLLAQLGDYVNVGVNTISIVDAKSFWIDGYFEETNVAPSAWGIRPKSS